MGKKIQDITYGMTIDHVPVKAVTMVYQVLREGMNAEGGCNMLMGEVESKRMGRKGIVKIDGLHMEVGKALHEVAILAPSATVNWIENGSVARKEQALKLLPALVESNMIECANNNCISREEAPGKFHLRKRESLGFECYYCHAQFELDQPAI